MKDGQFSLRTILGLLVCAGLGLAYYRNAVLLPYLLRQEKERVSGEFHDALRRAGGWTRGGNVGFGQGVDDRWLETHVAPIAHIFSDDESDSLFRICHIHKSKVTKDGLRHLPTYVASLDLSDLQLGDDVDALSAFPNLKSLFLNRTDVTMSGLQDLARVAPQLEFLVVDGTRLDDPSVLLRLPELRSISMLGGPPKESIAKLAEHPRLESIMLSRKTPGLYDFELARPDVSITFLMSE